MWRNTAKDVPSVRELLRESTQGTFGSSSSMKEPFERIAMDIVGPLPRNWRGNQYILVVQDYATRYPEAIPLCSIDAGTVADHLIQLFQELVFQERPVRSGTNFMSQLLKELYNLLLVVGNNTNTSSPDCN